MSLRVKKELRLDALSIGKSYSREELAAHWGLASRKAIERGVFWASGDNKILLFVTQIKRSDLTQYKDHIAAGLLFWEGEQGHGSDQRIAASRRAGDEIHLFFRQASRTKFVYMGPLHLLWYERRDEAPSQFVFRIARRSEGTSSDEIEYELPVDLESTVREATIEARIGQAKFRQRLLNRWDYRCSVTGVPIPEILRASHIKSWRASSASERLDPANGLLLVPQYDALFDRGFLSFSDDGRLLVGQHIGSSHLERLGIRTADRLRFVPPDSLSFLAHHREVHRFDHD